KHPPFLIVYADKDYPLLGPLAERLFKALQKTKCDAELLKVKNRDHVSIMRKMAEKNDPTAEALLTFVIKRSAQQCRTFDSLRLFSWAPLVRYDETSSERRGVTPPRRSPLSLDVSKAPRSEERAMLDEHPGVLLEATQHGDVTVVRFTQRTVLDPDAIEAVGERLLALVRTEGRRTLAL